MGPREILLSAFVPGLVAVALLVPAAFFLRRTANINLGQQHAPTSTHTDGRRHMPSSAQWCHSRLLSALLILLFVGATLLGSYAWQSRIDLWPKQAQYRFPLVATVAGLLGLFPAMLPMFRGPALLGPLSALAGGVVAWAFLSLLHESIISEPMRWTWIALSALLTATHALTLERVTTQLPGWRAPILLSGLVGLIALGATMNFANAPLVLGPVAAVAAGAMLASIVNPRLSFISGVGAATAVFITGTVVFANWFGDRERWAMYALLMAAPLATGLSLLSPFARRGPTIRFIAAAIPAVALAGIQSAQAIPPLIKSMSQPADTYEY